MEYKLSKLNDVTTYIARGITPKYTEELNGLSVINQKCIRDYKLLLENVRRHDISKKQLSAEKNIQKYDILINSTGVGTAGRVAQNFEDIPMTADSHVTMVRPDSNKIDPVYLGYAVKNKQKFIEGLAEGSTGQTEISRQRIGEEIYIKYPDSVEVQKRISNFLLNIDKKIAINNKINDNLLNMLRNSFKEVFIDNSKNYWEEQKLENIVSIRRGASPRPIQNFLSSEGVNWLKISDVTGIETPFIYSIKEKIIEDGKRKSVFIKRGTLVVSNSATPGIPKFIMVDTCVHDGWLVLSDFDKKYKNYIYFLIEHIRENLVKLANGSVFNNLKTDILKEYNFLNPDDDTLIKFNNIAEPVMRMINNNTLENIHLENLRDTLLPKLMNGEIDLDKIEI